MEFTRLAEVDIVETANDTDKVLIEQNGKIKRVPKTEVGGGGGGNVLIVVGNAETETFEANMTLTEAIAALHNGELSNAVVHMSQQGMLMQGPFDMIADYSAMAGIECMAMTCAMMNIELCWTA